MTTVTIGCVPLSDVFSWCGPIRELGRKDYDVLDFWCTCMELVSHWKIARNSKQNKPHQPSTVRYLSQCKWRILSIFALAFFLASTQIFTALRCKPYSCTVVLFARPRSSLGWLTHGACISRSMHASAWWKYCFMRFLLIFTNLWSFSAEDTCRHCKVWFAVNSHFCAAFGSVVVPQHSGSLVCRQATRQPPAVTGDASVQQGALKLELNLSSFEQKQQQRTCLIGSDKSGEANALEVHARVVWNVCLSLPWCETFLCGRGNQTVWRCSGLPHFLLTGADWRH